MIHQGDEIATYLDSTSFNGSPIKIELIRNAIFGKLRENSNDLKQQYKNARIVGEGRVVYNIKGNAYRLVVAVDYEFQVIFVRFIGTHKQYDKIDVKTI